MSEAPQREVIRARPWGRIGVAAILLVLALAAVGQRLYTFDEPLERDLALYAVVAHQMLEGRDLYSDLWDHKPPAIFLTYAAAEIIAGYGPGAVFLLNVVAALATLAGVYWAGSGTRGGAAAGLWAAALWTAAGADLNLQANQPNTEVFINALLVWAFGSLVRARSEGGWRGTGIVAGILIASASLYKQLVVVPAALIAAAHVLVPPAGSRDRRRAWLDVAGMAAVGAVTWALVFGYFAASGRLGAFYQAVFEHNRFYAQDVAGNVLRGLLPARLFPGFMIPLAGVALLSVVGAARGLWLRSRTWLLWAGFALGTFLQIALPGRGYPHYHQLWLPVLAVGAGWAIVDLSRLAVPRARWVGNVVGAVVLVVTLSYQVPGYRTPARQWPLVKYGPEGVYFIESVNLGRAIGAALEQDETFYEWGSEAGLYFYSQKRPPSGVMMAYPLLREPTAESFTRRVLDDLEREKPELFVALRPLLRVTEADTAALGYPIVRYLRAHYEPLPWNPSFESFALFARRGGRLHRTGAGMAGPRGD
jgi:4-amino-4-deoxy-L-arabinose transferase-like glycosyltransferase